MALKHQQH